MDPVLKSYRVKQKVGRLAAWVLFQGKALGGTGSGLPVLTCKAAMGRWMSDYNHERIHQGLDYECPWSLYRPKPGLAEAA
jgi:transposase InsO family protein